MMKPEYRDWRMVEAKRTDGSQPVSFSFFFPHHLRNQDVQECMIMNAATREEVEDFLQMMQAEA